ncbi:hypothetical protein ABPG74_015950 [Tetrahymena malaccensis]
MSILDYLNRNSHIRDSSNLEKLNILSISKPQARQQQSFKIFFEKTTCSISHKKINSEVLCGRIFLFLRKYKKLVMNTGLQIRGNNFLLIFKYNHQIAVYILFSQKGEKQQIIKCKNLKIYNEKSQQLISSPNNDQQTKQTLSPLTNNISQLNQQQLLIDKPIALKIYNDQSSQYKESLRNIRKKLPTLSHDLFLVKLLEQRNIFIKIDKNLVLLQIFLFSQQNQFFCSHPNKSIDQTKLTWLTYYLPTYSLSLSPLMQQKIQEISQLVKQKLLLLRVAQPSKTLRTNKRITSQLKQKIPYEEKLNKQQQQQQHQQKLQQLQEQQQRIRYFILPHLQQSSNQNLIHKYQQVQNTKFPIFLESITIYKKKYIQLFHILKLCSSFYKLKSIYKYLYFSSKQYSNLSQKSLRLLLLYFHSLNTMLMHIFLSIYTHFYQIHKRQIYIYLFLKNLYINVRFFVK